MKKAIRLAVAARVFRFVFFSVMMVGFDNCSVVIRGILGVMAFKLLTGLLIS